MDAIESADGSAAPSSPSGALHVYAHIPYCAKACSYCYYVRVVGHGQERRSRYLDSLERETTQRTCGQPRRALTLYLGGGTPTLLTAGELERVKEILVSGFEITDGIEFSVETTPLECRPDKLATLRALGANRLSIGVQSIDDALIRSLDRARNEKALSQTICAAVTAAREAGFANLNCDLIVGLPGETEASVEASLALLIELGIPHISIYPLQVGLTSKLFFDLAAGVCSIGSQTERRHRYHSANAFLAASGYLRVGIAHFARDRHWACRQHAGVWNGEDLVGLGVSAQSFDQCIYRRNTADIGTYNAASPDGIIAARHVLGRDDVIRRWVFTQLSRKLHFNLRGVSARWGDDGMRIIGPLVGALVGAKLAEKKGTLLSLTEEGAEQTNRLVSELLQFDNQDYVLDALRGTAPGQRDNSGTGRRPAQEPG